MALTLEQLWAYRNITGDPTPHIVSTVILNVEICGKGDVVYTECLLVGFDSNQLPCSLKSLRLLESNEGDVTIPKTLEAIKLAQNKPSLKIEHFGNNLEYDGKTNSWFYEDPIIAMDRIIEFAKKEPDKELVQQMCHFRNEYAIALNTVN